MNEKIDIILRGRKIKKILNIVYKPIREKYDLKQIEIEILFYLARTPNANSSEIYRTLYLNKGHVSSAMDSLGTKGYLISEQDADNRRYVCYNITENGMNIVNECFEIRKSIKQKLFAGINEEEMEFMKILIAKLYDNIDAIENEYTS